VVEVYHFYFWRAMRRTSEHGTSCLSGGEKDCKLHPRLGDRLTYPFAGSEPFGGPTFGSPAPLLLLHHNHPPTKTPLE